eukprot:256958_1
MIVRNMSYILIMLFHFTDSFTIFYDAMENSAATGWSFKEYNSECGYYYLTEAAHSNWRCTAGLCTYLSNAYVSKTFKNIQSYSSMGVIFDAESGVYTRYKYNNQVSWTNLGARSGIGCTKSFASPAGATSVTIEFTGKCSSGWIDNVYVTATTPAPSPSPTPSPTPPPTPSPTLNPTHLPTTYPTTSPTSFTFHPTSFPTDAPTFSPSQSPTTPPTNFPTTPPSSAPILNPTRSPTIAPSYSPTSSPTLAPTLNPSYSPSNYPTASPSNSPSSSPSGFPTNSPTIITVNPSNAPSLFPTFYPTYSPSNSPSTQPSAPPTNYPSYSPSHSPTWAPSNVPSVAPSNVPSVAPSLTPTLNPINAPTFTPTLVPSLNPTISPSLTPSFSPTQSPSIVPSLTPTQPPSTAPSFTPTTPPSNAPSTTPTLSPSTVPSISPTTPPSNAPTENPTNHPSKIPTKSPTLSPSNAPTESPTLSPSNAPSATPTSSPSVSPSVSPTSPPSLSPSLAPSNNPTTSPSNSPTISPSIFPSATPTTSPSISPSQTPTNVPTQYPTYSPSTTPTLAPSIAPTNTPSTTPTLFPTDAPSDSPSNAPTYSPSNAPTNAPSTSPTPRPTYYTLHHENTRSNYVMNDNQFGITNFKFPAAIGQCMNEFFLSGTYIKYECIEDGNAIHKIYSDKNCKHVISTHHYDASRDDFQCNGNDTYIELELFPNFQCAQSQKTKIFVADGVCSSYGDNKYYKTYCNHYESTKDANIYSYAWFQYFKDKCSIYGFEEEYVIEEEYECVSKDDQNIFSATNQRIFMEIIDCFAVSDEFAIQNDYSSDDKGLTEHEISGYAVAAFMVIAPFILILVALLFHKFKSGSDNPGYISLFKFFASNADFYTDAIWAFTLYSENNRLYYWSFSFAFGPHLISIIVGLFYIVNWRQNRSKRHISEYAMKFDTSIIFLTLLSGFYATTEIITSHLFHLNILSLQITTKQKSRILNLQILNEVILEDIPCFYIQYLYLTTSSEPIFDKGINITLLAMIFGILSMISGVLTLGIRIFNGCIDLARGNNLETIYIQLSFTSLQEVINNKHTHSHSLLSDAIAGALHIQTSQINIIYIQKVTKGIKVTATLQHLDYNNTKNILKELQNVKSEPFLNLHKECTDRLKLPLDNSVELRILEIYVKNKNVKIDDNIDHEPKRKQSIELTDIANGINNNQIDHSLDVEGIMNVYDL